MKTYIFKLIMKPHIIKKQGDGLNSYELGHSLVFFALFENIIMNTYIWEYKCILRCVHFKLTLIFAINVREKKMKVTRCRK